MKFWVLTGLIANQRELIYQEEIFKAEERRVCPYICNSSITSPKDTSASKQNWQI